VVEVLLETAGIDLSNGAGYPEQVRLQEHLREYKTVVYRGLICGNVIFEGQVGTTKRINVLYDDGEHQFHVIAKLTAAMSKELVCEGCKKSCTSDITDARDQTCSDYMACPPCTFSGVRSHMRNSKGTFEITRVSRTTRSVPRRKNHYVNESGAVRRADGS